MPAAGVLGVAGTVTVHRAPAVASSRHIPPARHDQRHRRSTPSRRPDDRQRTRARHRHGRPHHAVHLVGLAPHRRRRRLLPELNIMDPGDRRGPAVAVEPMAPIQVRTGVGRLGDGSRVPPPVAVAVPATARMTSSGTPRDSPDRGSARTSISAASTPPESRIDGRLSRGPRSARTASTATGSSLATAASSDIAFAGGSDRSPRRAMQSVEPTP